MRFELIDPFLNSTMSVIQMMAMTELKAGERTARSGPPSYGAVTAIVPLVGSNCDGHMLVSFDEPSILGIVGRMLGEEYSAMNDQVADAAGEIANMICGGAKRDLVNLGVTIGMSTPKVVIGEHGELEPLALRPAIAVPFETPDGKFVVEASLSFATNT